MPKYESRVPQGPVTKPGLTEPESRYAAEELEKVYPLRPNVGTRYAAENVYGVRLVGEVLEVSLSPRLTNLVTLRLAGVTSWMTGALELTLNESEFTWKALVN